LVGAVAGLTLVLLWAAPAGADITGPCTATMKGIPIKGRSHTDKSKAIPVDANETLTVSATSDAAPIDSYDVKMEFAGFKWNVASGKADGNTWSKVVKVNDYATFGVGLYKVYGVSNGATPCTGAALVKVGGKFPLTTVAGAIGAILAAAAALGAVSGIRKSGSANKVPKGQEAFDRQYKNPTGAGYRVDPVRYIDNIVSSPCPGVYVDCLEGIQRAGGGWNEVSTVCFQTPAQPRDVVSFVCKWG
jgi:hypothetical protein